MSSRVKITFYRDNTPLSNKVVPLDAAIKTITDGILGLDKKVDPSKANNAATAVYRTIGTSSEGAVMDVALSVSRLAVSANRVD